MNRELFVCEECIAKMLGQVDLDYDDLPDLCSFCRGSERKGIIIRFRLCECSKDDNRKKEKIEIIECLPNKKEIKVVDLIAIIRIHLRRQKADKLIDNIRFSKEEENYFEK